MDLPVYKILVNEDDQTGVDYISLVDKPAIQKDFLAFDSRAKFAIQSEEKRIVTGAAMIADLPIYRFDSERGEYYVIFDKETIWTIAKKFARKGYYNNVNTDHADPVNDGVYMIESYFTNKERGIMPPKGFEDVADGSWFVTYLIDNEEIWNKVKDGTWNGFSVEGIFDMEQSGSIAHELRELNNLIKAFLNNKL